MAIFDVSTYALIQDFLQEKLPVEEAEKVRQRIKKDSEFAREVEWMKEFHLLMNKRTGAQLLDTFTKIHRKQQRKTQRIRWVIGIATVLLLTVAVLLIRATSSKDQENPEITPSQESSGTEQEAPSQPDIDTMAVPPVAPIKSPSGPIAKIHAPSTSIPWEQYVTFREGLQTLGEEEDAAFDQAIILLDAGKRVEALPLLEKYLSSLPAEDQDFELRLEAGKIYLEGVKDYTKAVAHFQAVERSDAIPSFKLEASFYRALTYLASGDIAQADKRFRELSTQPMEPWKSKAAQLIELLQKNR